MSKEIDKGIDDDVGIRWHISSARMDIKKMSYVAFQKYLDRMNKSMYRCPACGWGGSGKNLVPMETDENDVYAVTDNADSWYACPKCKEKIDTDAPVVSPVD